MNAARHATKRPRRRYRAALAAGLVFGATSVFTRAASPAMETARLLNEAFVEVADKVSPAVVVIEVAHRPDFKDDDDSENPLLETVPPDLRRRLEEESQKRRAERSPHHPPVFDGRGSGMVIREDGWILTNEHVVKGAEKLRVRTREGRTYEAQGQWFTDPQSDIAVVKVDAHGLAVVKLGDSSKTRVGEFAIAIGAPFELDYSVTFGHISAKGRSHIIPGWTGGALGASMDQDFLQTDASINPGNSGGPLININGEVIGVNTLIRGMNRGIGFAVPSKLASEVAERLISEGRYARAWLGIQINALRDDVHYRDLLPGVEDGVVVTRILPNGPAAKSGLKPADVITAVEGTAVISAQQLRYELRARKIGTPITLQVARPDEQGAVRHIDLQLRTQEWPAEASLAVPPAAVVETNRPSSLGLTVQPATKELADKFGVDMASGLIVTAVERGSLAAQARIRTGDIITEINHKPVRSTKEFQEASRRGASKPMLIELINEGAPEFRILKDGGD